MSSTIWTRCGGSSNVRPLVLEPWRAVEAQHVVSTRKLVDSDEEQLTLEQLIERSKRPLPPDGEARGIHYLLVTPFRYPPLAHGSRFGTRHERGIWYGARSRRTAFSEVAYYRLLFLEGTAAELPPIMTQLTLFRVPVRTTRGVDLTAAPFDAWREELASRTSYDATQSLGRSMRETGAEAFRYPAARDVLPGVGMGLFTPRAFAAMRPRRMQSWLSVTTRSSVELSRRDVFTSERWRFPREEFLVGGALPAPAP
ncbi:MAG: RES family NAD+ phosphorylase [Acidobacteriota bacterium]|nr:RES family NAD+ phosphorylase [Acidobacteriota bacterium]